MVKLDIGCGKSKREGFIGIDQFPFEGVDVVMNLTDRWPYEDGSVDEIHCSHVIEHFTADQRCWIMNEAHRVLKTGAQMTVIAPHWSSGRAYGDPTHQWPPVCDMWFYYLQKAWRDSQAPHTNPMLTCDFNATWGYAVNPALNVRNAEYQQHAIATQREAILDIHATLVKI